jgi:putative peptidoglycan lipid II flippase
VESRPARGERLAWSTAIFSLATGLSRILGLIREIVAAYFFGARGAINAFTVSFQIPNLIRAIVADAALSSAFVPVFTELHEKGERARAWRVASSLIWLLLLLLSALTALFILLAPWFIPLFDLPADHEDLAIRLSQLLFPIVVLLGLSGIVVGILNSYEHFTVPALTPAFWNLAIIVGLALGVPQAGSEEAELYVYAGSILAGTVLQLVLPVPWLAGRDGRLRAVIDWRDPAVGRVFALMLPVSLGLGLINFNALVATFFAARYIDPEIAPTAIDKAFRVYMLPQGMFSVAVATVLFPRLARLAARADMADFRHTLSLGLRQIGFLLIPASVVSAVLAHPIIRLLYERGDFEPDQTPVVANALAAFSLGLAFNGAMLMLNRAFFSLQAPWTPTLLALGNLLLNTALNFAFYPVGTWGLPLATSIANIAGAAALLLVLRRRLGRLELAETASSTVRIALASLPLAAASYAVWRALDEALGRTFPAELASVGAALLVGFAIYLISCRLLRVRELEALLTLRSRFRRA